MCMFGRQIYLEGFRMSGLSPLSLAGISVSLMGSGHRGVCLSRCPSETGDITILLRLRFISMSPFPGVCVSPGRGPHPAKKATGPAPFPVPNLSGLMKREVSTGNEDGASGGGGTLKPPARSLALTFSLPGFNSSFKELRVQEARDREVQREAGGDTLGCG